MENPIHLLLMAIVQEQDLDAATKALQNIGASLTYLSSAGGFLGRRNATLLIGLPTAKEAEALAALQKVCRQRIEYMTLPLEGSPMPMPAPVPVTVGGATVFALPVERFEQILNQSITETTKVTEILKNFSVGSVISVVKSGEVAMKMIIVIVKDNDADMLTQAFTANSFRVTRVASTGGFMRSGVVTMLLGVEEEQVDAALQTVRNSLPPKPDQKRATIFVVPVQHFEQV